jgi:CHAD domain-containing protein
MAFELRSDESVADGLRRLAAKELRRARREVSRAVPPGDKAVHDARRSVKKARAILQLVQANHGRRLDGSRKRLRSVNRTLSRLRDTDAMQNVLEQLREANPRLVSQKTFARIRRRLASIKREAIDTVKPRKYWGRIDKMLRALRRSAKHWTPRDGGFDAVAPGIRRAHKRGRKALSRARRQERAEDFHEWRKAMKTLWYALRLVERSCPRVRRDIAALHRAETWLGDEHNAVVLCTELSRDRSVCRSAADLDRLRLAADTLQCAARARALKATSRLYARKSGEYLRGIRRGWKGRAAA